MSVEGVGIATIISNGVMGALAFLALKKSDDKVCFRFDRFRFYSSELSSLVSSTPAVIKFVWPIGWILPITTQLIAYFPTMSKLKKRVELKLFA